MDFARQEARAEVSPSRAIPPQLPSSPKIRPRARRQSQVEEERGEGGVRREPGERGEMAAAALAPARVCISNRCKWP
jgi:hypothetical protein